MHIGKAAVSVIELKRRNAKIGYNAVYRFNSLLAKQVGSIGKVSFYEYRLRTKRRKTFRCLFKRIDVAIDPDKAASFGQTL